MQPTTIQLYAHQAAAPPFLLTMAAAEVLHATPSPSSSAALFVTQTPDSPARAARFAALVRWQQQQRQTRRIQLTAARPTRLASTLGGEGEMSWSRFPVRFAFAHDPRIEASRDELYAVFYFSLYSSILSAACVLFICADGFSPFFWLAL
jgi:hypothetical protein